MYLTFSNLNSIINKKKKKKKKRYSPVCTFHDIFRTFHDNFQVKLFPPNNILTFFLNIR